MADEGTPITESRLEVSQVYHRLQEVDEDQNISRTTTRKGLTSVTHFNTT